jgi:hypothetical protein
MANVGQCLLFYLKYPAEMDRLYDYEDEPDTEGLDDPESTLKRITRIGDQACKEIAQLLATCAAPIETHLAAISDFRRVRSNLERDWELRYRVAPPKGRVDWRLEIGISVDHHRKAIRSWIWCKGGRRASDSVLRALGRGFSGASLSWHPGSMALAEATIPLPSDFDEPVPQEPIVSAVVKSIQSLTADEVRTIDAIARA